MTAKSVLQIPNFQEQYLTSTMKRYKMKTPAWMRVPTDSVEVIELINGHPNGLAHLGAWERLQAWAVRNWKTGGLFIVRQRPMTVSDIAVHSGLQPIHVPILEAAIPRFIDLGWLVKRSSNDLETIIETFEKRLTERIQNSTAQNRTIQWSKDSGFTNISDSDMKGWIETHPNLDIGHELKKMADWLKSNPRGYKQYRRFITNWLNRARPNGPAPISSDSGWLKDLGDD
jgi:hypothetical protein